jgi:hypothetical protein
MTRGIAFVICTLVQGICLALAYDPRGKLTNHPQIYKKLVSYIYSATAETKLARVLQLRALGRPCAPYTAISIKVVHEQSGKVEYERERLLGTALKIH